jgi:hypothetical protein
MDFALWPVSVESMFTTHRARRYGTTRARRRSLSTDYASRQILHVWSVVLSLFFSLVSWGGVRLSPLGTSATLWPIVPALGDRWWVWSSRWNENWQGKPKYSEKTFTSATLSTTNPTWPDLASNPGLRGGKPATNRLSYILRLIYPLKLWPSSNIWERQQQTKFYSRRN